MKRLEAEGTRGDLPKKKKGGRKIPREEDDDETLDHPVKTVTVEGKKNTGRRED